MLNPFILALVGLLQCPCPLTVAWDLDPSHDGDVRWELEVNGVVQVCGSVVVAADRRCTGLVSSGQVAARLRGVRQTPEVQVGAWSYLVTDLVGSPGVFTVMSFLTVPAIPPPPPPPPPPPQTLPVFRSASFVSRVANGSTVGEPVGTAQNDLLIGAFIGAAAGTLALPSGWTSINSGSSPSGQFDWSVGWIRRGTSPPALMFTTGGTVYHAVLVLSVSGNGTIRAQSPIAGATNGQRSPDPPAVTAVGAGLIVTLGMHWNGSSRWTPPAGYTIAAVPTGVDRLEIAWAWKTITAGGVQNPGPFAGQVSGAIDLWDGVTLAIAP